jgi:hypothetical protein
VLVAAVKPQGSSMPATAVSQEFFSIRISLTSTLRFIRKSSMAKNALAKAVFFNRLGEMRDRSFENQRYRSRSRSLNIAGHPKRVVQMIVPEVQLEEWLP